MAETTPLQVLQQALIDAVEQTAIEWDGCDFDAPGGSLDIGDAIRRSLFPRINSVLAGLPAAAPSVQPVDEHDSAMLWLGSVRDEFRRLADEANATLVRHIKERLLASPSMGSAAQQSDRVHQAAGQASRTAVQAAPNVPQDGGLIRRGVGSVHPAAPCTTRTSVEAGDSAPNAGGSES